MDTSPALLLLLALGFCCPGIYGQSLEIKVVSPKDISQLQLGQRLELKCQTNRNSGAFWIRKDKKGTLHFIVFISSTAKTVFGNQIKATHFEASKYNAIYYLAVKSFTPQDEGNYFCVMNYNQMLYFSPGQTAFLPGSRMQENLEHFCLTFLWIPLAGLCLLLLQLLATIIVLRQHMVHHDPL